jgi:hypothetical protein
MRQERAGHCLNGEGDRGSVNEAWELLQGNCKWSSCEVKDQLNP